MNLSFLLFSGTMIMGTTLAISSSSWIMMWIGLEMNLMSFIPLMKGNNTPHESEASMKYFLTQAMASSILMMAILLTEATSTNSWLSYGMLVSALLMKMGAAPFHLWMPSVMEGLKWSMCLTLMTWQKIAPMIMMSYQIKNNMMTNAVVVASVSVGAIGGLAQTSIRKMFAYSSISHVGWMIMAMMMSSNYWTTYFLLYVSMNMAATVIFSKSETMYLEQVFNMKTKSKMKMMMFISMLSLGGMPPFMGFVPKWIIIQNMIMFQSYLLILIMVMTTLITLYMYMRMMYSSLTFSSQSTSWQNQQDNSVVTYLSMGITLLGIPLITCLNLT
uniref:NADH-ubiquinone oxidoreductase chain 2 n=1 Tax=Psolodesmus mandarinus TaxID=193280 RepID=A0A4P2SJN2_9ODON|nr:NADH dehydrogenase subunit 2 [Psolodesmus mandarinus]AWH61857.1 NADH dehydrogenase subunit 2 [Psolodesmus mandarinus]